MTPLVGAAVLIAASALGLVTAVRLRTRLPRPVADGLMSLVGAGIGVGGLSFLPDASVASWVVGTAALAMIAPLHMRALFAGGGPFRT